MPLLGQVDAGIYRDVQPVPWPGVGGGGVPANQAGPNAAMMRLGLEEQENQQIRQLAQQYGSDYDGLVEAVSQINPKRGFELKSALEASRKEAAAKSIEETKGSIQKLDMGARWLQTAAEQPDLYPVIRNEILKQAGPAAGMYNSILPQPGDPDLSDKLTKIVTGIALPTKDYLETKNKAAQLYFDGKKVEGALTLLAGSKTPEQWKHSADIVKGGGLGQLLGTVTDPASAQTMLEQQQKAAPEATAVKVGSFEDYVTRKFGPTPTPDQVLQARKEYGQADDRPRVSVSVSGAGTGALTSEGVDYAATQYRLTGKMPPMGMGNSQARAAIINKAAEQVRIIGQTPVASIQRQAAFSADSKSLGKLQSMADAAGAYENKALAQLDIVDGLSNKVSRTSIPLINRAIMAGKTEIQGDPDATLLLNAIMTASTEYAKIMMGGTGSAQAVTDSAMKESQKLLNASMNQATLRQATALMRKEMGLTMQGYDAALGHINERMGGQSQQATPTAPTAPKVQKWKRDASGKLVPE